MRRLALAACAVAACAVALGCGKTGPVYPTDRSVRQGSEVRAAVEDVPVLGFQAEVELRGYKPLDGELIAATPSTLYVRPKHGPTWAIPSERVERVTIALREVSAAEKIVVWTWVILGTGQTASHGVWAVVSCPIWVGTTVPIAALAANADTHVEAEGALGRLVQYARFPQGLPPGFATEPLP